MTKDQRAQRAREPIPMILYCPKCHEQHVDEPDERTPDWDNPPHRSHLCHACGCIWRPCDVATEGVRSIKTAGERDTWGWDGASLAAFSDAERVGEGDPVEPSALDASIAELDAWEASGTLLDEIENWAAFGENVMLVLHECKRLRSLNQPAASVVEGERSPAQFFFEVGFGSCWAEAFVRNGSVPPFQLTDAVVERAWPIAGEAHDDPEEFERYLSLALSAAPSTPVGEG